MKRGWGLLLLASIAVIALVGYVTVRQPHRERLMPPVAVTTAGSYTFIAMDGEQPVTYNPCKPIRYELNMTSAPPGAEQVLASAIQVVEGATGLKFTYVGTTERRPLDKAPRRLSLGGSTPPPVVISWATADEAPALAGRIAGYAGSSYITFGGRPSRFITGQVVLDAEVYGRLLSTSDGSAAARAITMHELGHLVGLDHVDDPRELMHTRNVGQLDFGSGDLAGLARLGQGRCR